MYDLNDAVEQLIKSQKNDGFVEDLPVLAKGYKTKTVGSDRFYVDGPHAGKKVGSVRGQGSPAEPKKGSHVKTKHGKAVVQSINTSTYSIPMAIVKLSEGAHSGETMMVSLREITLKN